MSPLFGRGQDPRDEGPRSTDEREQARREREARRAAREGRPPPTFDDGPPASAPPLASAPGTAEPAPGPAPSSQPEPRLPAAAPTRGADAGPTASDADAGAPPSFEKPPTPRPLEVPFDVEPTVSRNVPLPDPDAWHEAEDEPSFDFGRRPSSRRERRRQRKSEPVQAPGALPRDEDSYEPAVRVQRQAGDAPVGIRRVPASQVASAAGAEGPPRFGAPPRGKPRSRRGIRRVLPLLGLLIVAAVAGFFYLLLQPGAGDGKGTATVVIPRGASAEQIGDVLDKQGVVDSSFFFALRARLSGKRDELRSGTLTLKKDMSYGAAIKALTAKPDERAQPVITKLLIPEGRSRKEIVPLAEKADIQGSYLSATRKSPDLSFKEYGAPKATPSLEGFLFPATYDVTPGSTATALVAQQVKAFKANFGQISLTRAKRRQLDAYDVLIIASMIEREAGVEKDRALISAVIYNRLAQGMPLGIDATIRYRLNNWTKPLTQSELDTDSDYNTRKRTGLPPTPIGNPGLASMKAAAKPAKVDYLYYVVKPGGKGAHAFSSTDAQFQKDVAAYNAARAANGGNDPSGR